ncbi:MAG: transglycosylase domain-containing protein [bacterium]|nr:transglycosylase domain-containing protein [bacterium]
MRKTALKKVRPPFEQSRKRAWLYVALVAFLGIYFGSIPLARSLQNRYVSLFTARFEDRSGVVLSPASNTSGNFAAPAEEIPPLFETLLLRKEDRYFYYHLGVNPFSMLRGLLSSLHLTSTGGSSTITQQLTKILLENEGERTLVNKMTESLYAVALELHTSKRAILTMYEGVAYFGKNRQGVAEASTYFFNKKPAELSESEIVQLIAALGSPSTRFPGSARNVALLPSVAKATGSDLLYEASSSPPISERLPSLQASFELKTLGLSCDPCELTIDADLTERIRASLRLHVDANLESNVHNGAVVVLKLPENEILAIVGSPNPKSLDQGAQLNMAIEPRPIGSTAKPFIYLNAFEKGARPYTLVDDEEYSYKIGTGFAFYPKNFDGKFRGEVALHNALSNSLNVPAVKVLEYVGLQPFYDFMKKSLVFTSRQPLERYELGIALGALEMDLLTLSHYFTIFPNGGVLKPLTLEISRQGQFKTPMEKPLSGAKKIADLPYIQLVTKILSDRETAVEQFGLRSNLTLPYKNYALKTGTSGNYHDSWTVGFTPDFLVGVWLGNSDNTAMRELTGQTGAGAVFQDVMTLLYTSPYNHNTPFSFSHLKEFTDSGSIEYGLDGDNYASIRALLKNPSLIISPHDGDIIELQKNTIIPLKAREAVDWYIDGAFLAHGKEISFSPTRTGKIKVEAREASKSQTHYITTMKEN